MEYNSVPIFPYSILIEPVGPAGNCLDPESVKIWIPDPEILKSGFFESCRARYGFRYVPMKPRWVLGAKFWTGTYQRKMGRPILKWRRSIAPLLELRVDLSQVAKIRVALSQAAMTTESIKGKNFQIILNQMEVDAFGNKDWMPWIKSWKWTCTTTKTGNAENGINDK